MEAGIVNFIMDLYLKIFQRLIAFSLNLLFDTVQTLLLKFNFVSYEEKGTAIKEKKVNNDYKVDEELSMCCCVV